MKLRTILFLGVILAVGESAQATESCTCKCVTKDSDGKYTTLEASGKDREAAGENLKKSLGKNKCELTPTCTGKCVLD